MPSQAPTHIGIYAGTFDPVHAGHIAFAREAERRASLSKVLFVPEAAPRSKANVTPLASRVQQLHAAGCEVYQAGQPQFTIAATLSELCARYPQAQLSFLMGSDVALGLSAWPDIQQLTSNHQLIIGMRSTDNQHEVVAVLSQLGAHYTIVTTPHAHVSSRQLRMIQ